MLDEVFKKLGLSSKETTTYLTLLENGALNAGSLSKRMGLPRSSVYDSLKSLHERGLVVQSERSQVKLWAAESPETLLSMLSKEASSWEGVKASFLTLLPELKSRESKDFVTPRFSYFEGVEGVKNILRDMLLYRDIQTQAFWPARDMLEILGKDFFYELNRSRIRQNIYTQGIWPRGASVDIKEYPCFGVGEKFRREIRLAPEGLQWSMGYWAYQNKVAFVSSRKECFGFIVESNELRQMLKTQFEVVWGLSKRIEVAEKSLESFLKTV